MKRAHIPVPMSIQRLPLTEKGYYKPWFVKEDDFRVTDPDKAWQSVSEKVCWICGEEMGNGPYALLGGPNIVKKRQTKEPPCHVDCAEYAVQVCPFILYPEAKRRESGLAQENRIEFNNLNRLVKIKPENPGEYRLVVVRDYQFDHKYHVIRFAADDVAQCQRWVEGERQQSSIG